MRHFIALFFVLAATSVSAQPSAEQLQLARQLVDLLDYRAVFAAYLKQCNQPSGTYFDPKVAFNTDPGSFGGVSPQSVYWPEVEATYRKYQTRVCSYLSAETFSRYYAEEFAKHVQIEDLRTAIAFHSSPAGRRLQQASLAVNESFQAFAESTLRSVYQQAYKETLADVRAIARKYQKEPQ